MSQSNATMLSPPQRCAWAKSDLAIAYHDQEWGVPVRDERLLFEFLILEGAQAGLSWETILRKRGHYRAVFDGFDARKIARYTPARIDKLLADPGIVRHRLKVESTVTNAAAFLKLQDKPGGFAGFVWQFVDGTPLRNHWHTMADVPARSTQSDALSKALKSAGFRFVGSTICYAYMQAVGMVNDHLVNCPRHAVVERLKI